MAAAAVLLDAFVIRMLIVPAIMHRMGPANWWLPGWLDRVLPHLTVEGDQVLMPATDGQGYNDPVPGGPGCGPARRG